MDSLFEFELICQKFTKPINISNMSLTRFEVYLVSENICKKIYDYK